MQEVSPDESKYSVSGRKIVLVIAKAGNTDEHWPRLLQSKDKTNNITVSCHHMPSVVALGTEGAAFLLL